MANSLIQRTHLLLVLLVFLCRSSADSNGRPELIREKRDPTFKLVAKGYSVDLDCRFKDPYSLESVSLSIELDAKPSKQTPRIVDGVKITKSGQIFTINDVQMSDVGRYWCKVGPWSSSIERLYVASRTQPGNYILTQSTVPENITTINEGDNVTIVCKVSGNGIKRVEWYKDKMELPSRYNNTGDFNISIADLTAVTVAQAGEYECRTSIIPTPWVGYQAESFVLQVIDGQSKALAQVYPVFGEVFSGQNVNISCQAPGNAVSMEWSRKGQIVSGIQTHRKIRKTAKGNFTESTLVLTNVSKADNGTYTCTVTTSQNVGYSNQATATLLVTECLESYKFADPSDTSGYFECRHGTAVKKSCPGNHVWNQEDKKCKIWPLDWVHDKDGKRGVIFDTNTLFALDCQLNDPGVTVQLKNWNQILDPQKNSGVTQIGQKFSINVSSLSIIGNIMELKCQALGSGGQVVLEKAITLVKATDFQNNVFVQILPVCSPGPLAIHDSVSIICHAYHFGVMGWYKIDKSSNVRKAISDSDPRLSSDRKQTRHGHWNVSKTLTLDNVTKNDEGAYVCWKSNGHNITKNITIYIDVADPSPATIEKLDSPQSFIKEGQNARFHCTVSGSPRPNVTWRRGQEIVAFCAGKYNSACNKTFKSRYKANWRDDRGCMRNYSMGPTSGGWVSWLNVNNLQYPADVKYTCEVENSLGKKKKVASLKIAVAPVLQGNTNDGPEKVYGVQDREEEIKCITERSNPPATFKWQYQPLNCSFSSSSCPKPTNNWIKLTQFGEIKNRSDNMSVLILPGYLKNMYFKCIAENPVTGAKDSKQYQFRRRTGPDVDYVKRQNDGGISKESTIVMITCVGFVVIVFFLLCLILYKRKKRYGGFYLLTLPPSPDYIMKLDPERSLLEQTNKLPYDAQWEFPRERVHIAKPLGSGAFGQVFLAQATGIVAFDPRGSTKRKPGRRRSRFGSTSRPYYNDKRVTAVAVKSLKDNATEAEYRDLLSELKILIHIGEHKNIVNLLGACTKGMERELWVIIEYCPHGNLLDFLRKRRDIFEPVWTTPTEHADVTFSTIDLYICSLQVARAMEFLASRRCVHRDLAARNVLVGENYVLKVADFGLARDIYKEEHYVKTTAGLLPVKWMAIEALVDRIYTHKSDVWSFGVLLWELFTLGGSPYPGLPANEVYQYLMEGQRMENPLNCPDEMYEIMRNCWDHSPDERPSFTDLVARIDKLLEDRTSESGEGYLDLEHAEDEPNLDEPTFEDEYLDPGQTLLPSPGSPTSEERMNYPLPPLPSEEIEMGTFEEPIKDEEKKKFVLLDPPREKRIARMDSELEKVRKDTLEREKPKDSVGHYNEDEFISEKEQLRSDDDDKDICERNSGVFEFSPDYEARHSHSLDVPPQENAYYGEQRPPSQGEVTFKAGNGFRGRQPSNRYVNS